MHGHGSDRSERVRSDIFWGESKYVRSHLQTCGPDDGNDVGFPDRAEAIIRRRIADGGGGIASLITQVEENADAHLEWAGCVRLSTEVGDGLTTDGILLVVEGDANLLGMA